MEFEELVKLDARIKNVRDLALLAGRFSTRPNSFYETLKRSLYPLVGFGRNFTGSSELKTCQAYDVGIEAVIRAIEHGST